MPRIIGVSAFSLTGPLVEEQQESLSQFCDATCTIRTARLKDLQKKLRRGGVTLQSGDMIVFLTVAVFPGPIEALVQFVLQAHEHGVAVRFLQNDVTLDPVKLTAELAGFLAMLAAHSEAQAAEQLARSPETRAQSGQPRKLSEKSILELKAELEKPKPNMAALARQLGISRATLYRYVKRISDEYAEGSGPRD
ncbi:MULTISPECIES: helix-turn-helix domain-containing protein [unclassified Novosphingobium]|uniref:helix-turn-helix domain-containing protein n=1 Tax=unclassified Novosphingobium TaxID=2644732 RepID=UPI001469A148|nr:MULTISPECIES: helix-turn-helix domain-containing protein [unclassified Novosphingobium]NMN89841.1 DNA invertase Pin-like site-specific DNA recombinase [Novosphingobium sp. SG916]